MIFRVGNVTVRLSFYFVALLVIMIILCNEKIIIYSLLSSLIHESGHLFFMCFFKDAPNRVELTLFGMRIDRVNKSSISYKKEIFIALGGIIFNLTFSAVCIVIYAAFGNVVFTEIAAINLIIAAVNSFPVSVLDAGRAVRYALLINKSKEKSEKYADTVSHCFVSVFTVTSVVYLYYYGINLSLIAINVYLIFITIIKKWS